MISSLPARRWTSSSTAAGTPFSTPVTLMSPGDVIHLAGVNAATASYNAGTGIVSYDIDTLPESFSLALPKSEFPAFVADNGGTDVEIEIACYLRGTRISTPTGEVAIEDLRAGDPVVVCPGVVRPVRWIGYRTIDLSRHPRPELARPVRIGANAIADGVPRRDLWVSPDHAIYFDGVLIPARLLCNGVTIAPEPRFRSVQYFHVELYAHGIIMAEGLPSECYLDTGNRGMFENADGPLILHPDFAPGPGQEGREACSCAPIATDAARVEPIWRWLADRARRLGHRVPEPETTGDPGLRVVIDGRAHRPVSVSQGCHRFVLPRSDGEVSLSSLANAPCELKPWLEDRRRLGVYVSRIVWHDRAGPHELPVDHPSLGLGWWDVERDGVLLRRWTDGDAAMRLPREAMLLEIYIGSGMVWRAGEARSDARRACDATRLAA